MSEIHAVETAVEALRQATAAGDGAALRRLFADEVSFGHSDGRVDRKADLLRTLDGQAAFRSIVQTRQTVEVVGDHALVRHVFDGERNQPDGSVKVAHLAVLQVWVRRGADWALLARQACPTA